MISASSQVVVVKSIATKRDAFDALSLKDDVPVIIETTTEIGGASRIVPLFFLIWIHAGDGPYSGEIHCALRASTLVEIANAHAHCCGKWSSCQTVPHLHHKPPNQISRGEIFVNATVIKGSLQSPGMCSTKRVAAAGRPLRIRANERWAARKINPPPLHQQQVVESLPIRYSSIARSGMERESSTSVVVVMCVSRFLYEAAETIHEITRITETAQIVFVFFRVISCIVSC